VRVLQLGKYFPPFRGGIEAHVHTLSHALARAGLDVDALVVNHASAKGDVEWRAAARTRTCVEHDGPVHVHRVGRLVNVAHYDVCARLPLLLSRLARRADVVHLHVPNPTMGVALAALPHLRTPLVITHHADVYSQRFLRHLLRPIDRLLYGRAARVFATSPPYNEASSLLGRYQDKVSVLPLGIDLSPHTDPSSEVLEEAARLRERYPEPRWLMVGRLVYYKGHTFALRAMQKLPGSLVVIGAGPLAGPLWDEARALGVGDRVTFLGEVREQVLHAAYHAATALLFPGIARSEAFGLAQVEAMASGCPVLNTHIPGSGVAWVCPHEEAGLTVPIEDPDALAAVARRLLDEPGLQERLGAAGRERALRLFGRDRMAATCAEHYRDVLA
jgi:glycosyltransferase involved in cell wall biosynthesis